MARWIFLIVLVFGFSSFKASESVYFKRGSNLGDKSPLTYLRKTLNSLDLALNFFHRNYDHINLDGVIGLRILEGSLKVLLFNLHKSGQEKLLPNNIVPHMRKLYEFSRNISDAAVPKVQLSEPLYYQRIGPLIQDDYWEFNYAARTLPTDVRIWPSIDYEVTTERQSDDCLTELFGTSKSTNETCVITDHCWRQMTSLGYSLYSLTHEIFYLQNAEKSGCSKEVLSKIEENGLGSERRLQDIYCANILNEATVIAEQGYPQPQRDLFMEQGALCGLYGYYEFFPTDWLDVILSWQNPALGCYQQSEEETSSGILKALRRHLIHKREERLLSNGCLSHATAVAIGNLAQYTRYLTEAYLNSISM